MVVWGYYLNANISKPTMTKLIDLIKYTVPSVECFGFWKHYFRCVFPKTKLHTITDYIFSELSGSPGSICGNHFRIAAAAVDTEVLESLWLCSNVFCIKMFLFQTLFSFFYSKNIVQAKKKRLPFKWGRVKTVYEQVALYFIVFSGKWTKKAGFQVTG